MTDAESRKQHSEQFLAKSGVIVDTSFPVFISDEQARIKSHEEIARRAIAAFLTAQVAIGICNDEDLQKSVAVFGYLLDKHNARDELTPDERRYFDPEHCGEIPYEDAFEMQWRVERCMPLFWALGMTDGDLDYPSRITDTDEIAKTICSAKDLSEIIGIVDDLDAGEILSNADTCMRMHLACVQSRELSDPEIKGDLDSDVVSEQYFGFCWMVGALESDDWDNPKPIF
ncbi:MAG: DUF4272 domain-containing protein [Oscillospiraceae bacterium]|nr:DUF4272 domain-containing protein [Oscillospiraceae bacterium]